MSKIDQIEEVLNVLKDIDALKTERVDLIAQNDTFRSANAKLEQAQLAADAANRHARHVVEKANADSALMLSEAKKQSEDLLEASRINAEEIVTRAEETSQAMINTTRANLAGDREAMESLRLERGVLESEVKALQAKHDELTGLIASLKSTLAGAAAGL